MTDQTQQIEPLDTDLSPEQARAGTDSLKDALTWSGELMVAMYLGRAWLGTGYRSWDAYCQGEFGSLRLRLPSEDRDVLVGSLRRAGLSMRAISSATGLGRGTVERSLEASPTVPNGTLEVVGTNGRLYRPVHVGEKLTVASPPGGKVVPIRETQVDPTPWRRSRTIDGVRRFAGDVAHQMLALKLASEIAAAAEAGDHEWIEGTVRPSLERGVAVMRDLLGVVSKVLTEHTAPAET